MVEKMTLKILKVNICEKKRNVRVRDPSSAVNKREEEKRARMGR
jgi:hypothetical protein